MESLNEQEWIQTVFGDTEEKEKNIVQASLSIKSLDDFLLQSLKQVPLQLTDAVPNVEPFYRTSSEEEVSKVASFLFFLHSLYFVKCRSKRTYKQSIKN
jgi:hypothetical protein